MQNILSRLPLTLADVMDCGVVECPLQSNDYSSLQQRIHTLQKAGGPSNLLLDVARAYSGTHYVSRVLVVWAVQPTGSHGRSYI